MSVFVLYALVPTEAVSSRVATSTGDLSVLARGAVAMVYQERDIAPPTSHQELVSFGRVVSEIAQRGATLPVRFGTVMDSLGEVEELLSEREEQWRERLAAVSGRVEILVHVRDDAAPAPTPAARGSGRDYLMSRAAARRHTDTLSEDLTAHLAPACRDLRRLRSSDEIRLACLVPEDGTERFRETLEAWAEARPSCNVTTTGPWPPFSFTEEERA